MYFVSPESIKWYCVLIVIVLCSIADDVPFKNIVVETQFVCYEFC